MPVSERFLTTEYWGTHSAVDQCPPAGEIDLAFTDGIMGEFVPEGAAFNGHVSGAQEFVAANFPAGTVARTITESIPLDPSGELQLGGYMLDKYWSVVSDGTAENPDGQRLIHYTDAGSFNRVGRRVSVLGSTEHHKTSEGEPDMLYKVNRIVVYQKKIVVPEARGLQSVERVLDLARAVFPLLKGLQRRPR